MPCRAHGKPRGGRRQKEPGLGGAFLEMAQEGVGGRALAASLSVWVAQCE